MSARVLIIGGGYIGRPVAQRLREEGSGVTGWVHSPEGAATLARDVFQNVIVGSVGDRAAWNGVADDFDWMIHCASSGRGGVEAYDEVFLQGMRCVGEFLPRARKVLVSSTSVYGQTQGELVDETSPAEPVSATSRVLREAEEVTLSFGGIIVRSAGIYGPERGVLFDKLRRGEAVIEGDGLRWMNQIHQRDLVAALIHLLKKGEPGAIYNASDDTPVTHRAYYQWCAEFLGVPLPPTGPVKTERKRGVTNKRISNAKLRATGWQPIYPSFREGLAADHSPK